MVVVVVGAAGGGGGGGGGRGGVEHRRERIELVPICKKEFVCLCTAAMILLGFIYRSRVQEVMHYVQLILINCK